MKILYAIQGTGNGHISRAHAIVPELQKFARVDVLVSGCESELSLPFPVRYRLHGLSFIFGRKGGISYWQTLLSLKPLQLLRDIWKLPVKEYDFIVTDFEPVSAWAAKLRNKKCVGLSHQFALLHPAVPAPTKVSSFSKWLLKNYAPVSAAVGIHFSAYLPAIHTPIIRPQVRNLPCKEKAHILVYLPAYKDALLLQLFEQIHHVKWTIFSKRATESYRYRHIKVRPVKVKSYLKVLSKCKAVLCGAGFDMPAEALHLGKKLLVVPMYNQPEQHFNAVALKQLGATVLPYLSEKELPFIREWLESPSPAPLAYPKNTAALVQQVLQLAKQTEIVSYASPVESNSARQASSSKY